MNRPVRKPSPTPLAKPVAVRPAVATPHAYQLAVACDTSSLIDADAALALSRAATKTLMNLSPRAAQLMIAFAEDEIYRLTADLSAESQASIAIIREALRGI